MNTALLFAAIAVIGWLVWSRPAAPAGLPPLSPLPAPLVPPAAPVAAGPHPLTILAILAAGGMIAFSIRENGTPSPQPAPAPVVGLDLRGRFVGPEAATDAATTAALLDELAGLIEYDALPVDNEGRPKEPRLKTGAAFDDLRRAAREGRCRGVSLGARQPAVRDAIKAFLDQQVGTDGGPVDAAQRAKWVAAFRAVAQAAQEATR